MRSVLALLAAACGSGHPRTARPSLTLVPMSEITRSRVAVVALEAPDGTEADVPTARLRALVAGRDDLILVDFARGLTEEKMLHNCIDEDARCLAAISADAGAEFVVFGHVAASGAVDLRLYGGPANRMGEPVVAHDGEVTHPRVARLLDGYAALCVSPLVLLGQALSGSTVAIDGRPGRRIQGGRTAIDGLAAGRHQIVVAPHVGEPLAVEIDLPCVGAQYHVTRAP